MSELSQELRHAVKLVQKEAATAQVMQNDEHQLIVSDTECSRELIVSFLLGVYLYRVLTAYKKPLYSVNNEKGREIFHLPMQ